ncbi:MAG: NAD(P)/FAD-dependent oxidoreductase [Geodermatophilaceae bacterium]
MGAEHGANRGHRTWLEDREREFAQLGYTEQPYCVIVGGGQGGIALGARLRQLGVPTIIIDKHARPGDQWRSRYKSLCLHDPVWYDHLPYLKFPSNWPVFSPKDKVADWLEGYATVMELNYWGSTTCQSASYDEATGEWTVVVDRDGAKVTLRPKQLIFATGVSGKKHMPTFEGMDVFHGQQQHSSEHPGPQDYADKKVVVIGSNNSAHDICAALWEVGSDVTMVQRSSTHIVRSESLMKVALGALYSEEAVAGGMTTEKADADLRLAAVPDHARIPDPGVRRDPPAGRRLLRPAGEGGLHPRLRRGRLRAVHEVLASRLRLLHRRRRLRAGRRRRHQARIRRGTSCGSPKTGVLLSNGKELPADLVVYATGYGSMNGWVADVVSQEVADKVGKVWGLGSATTKDPGPWEGEQRNMWKPTQQAALWFHGGNLHQSRYYSLYLALQLKARMEGILTPVYGLQETHHLR